MTKPLLTKARKQSTTLPAPRRAAAVAGPDPLAFLRAVKEGRTIEIGGQPYQPTRAEQRQATARLIRLRKWRSRG